MASCLLRVNRVEIQQVRLRPIKRGADYEILITDPQFGTFPITTSCDIRYLDLTTPSQVRSQLPNRGWRKISYDELRVILETMQASIERSRQDEEE